jgi:hypothetical protein
MYTELTRVEATVVLKNQTLETVLASVQHPVATSLGLVGPQGAPGPPGEPGSSGLEAEVPTDFVLIYRLST